MAGINYGLQKPESFAIKENDFHIGCSSTYRLTKNKLIEIIEKTFDDCYDSSVIAIVTETETRIGTEGLVADKVKNQTITFAIPLDLS